MFWKNYFWKMFRDFQRKLLWIILAGSKGHHMYTYRREKEIWQTQEASIAIWKEIIKNRVGGPVSQGIPLFTSHWKKQPTSSVLDPWKEPGWYQVFVLVYHWFVFLTSISLRKHMLFITSNFVVIFVDCKELIIIVFSIQ